MNKVIITGATSMIGVAIIEECLREKVAKIYTVIRPGTTKRSRLPKDDRICLVECSAENYINLPNMIKEDCDVFYHVAWSVTGEKRNDNIMEQARNIEYTIQALNVAKQLNCKKFIGTGSQAEYGKLNIDMINEKSPVNPVQPYGIAKYAAGKLAAEEAKRIGIDFVWIRIFSVYGKYDKPTTMIASTIKTLLEGRHASFTEAEQRWDYLYSSDAGRALFFVGDKVVGNKVYCLGSGQAYPLREYIEIIGELLDCKNRLGIGEIPYSDGTIMNLCADISELKKDTGWYPRVSFEDGVKEVIEYMKSN